MRAKAALRKAESRLYRLRQALCTLDHETFNRNIENGRTLPPHKAVHHVFL